MPAFIQGDGILKIHLALLQARDDSFQLPERVLKAQVFDGLGCRYDGTPACSLVPDAPPKRQDPIIAVMGGPDQLRAPAPRNYNSRGWGNKQFPCNNLSHARYGRGKFPAFS